MKDGTLNEIIFFSFLLICWGLANYNFIFVHEKIHQQIFLNYGIGSDVVYYFNPSTFNFMNLVKGRLADTVPDTVEGCNETCNSLHTLNEIEGYHSGAAMNALFIVVLVAITYHHLCIEKY